MTHSPNVCPEGWEAAQLLAFIERNLEPDVERDLARHLQECRVCALELESLRRLDSLLRRTPRPFIRTTKSFIVLHLSMRTREGALRHTWKAVPNVGRVFGRSGK